MSSSLDHERQRAAEPRKAAEASEAGKTCWVCGSMNSTLWKPRSIHRTLEPDDLRITDDRYGTTLALRKCGQCGFVFAEGAEVRELDALYARLSDTGYEESSEPRLLQMRWVLDKAMSAHPKARSMLDVGAAAGLLVVEGRRLGLDAVGVEPSRSLVEFGRDAYHADLLQGTLPHPDLAGRQFDLVFLIDIIEHVSDPVGLLRHVARHLRRDGIVVLVTPDVGSVAARALRGRWWHFRLAHVGYFNRHSLAIAAANAGLEVRELTRTRWFFSVGYLSSRIERYLPVGFLNRTVRSTRAGRRALERVIPLNLHDSLLVLLGHARGRDDGSA